MNNNFNSIVFEALVWVLLVTHLLNNLKASNLSTALVQKTTDQLGTFFEIQWDDAQTCFCHGFIGRWQFFLESFRASWNIDLAQMFCWIRQRSRNSTTNKECFFTLWTNDDKLLAEKKLIVRLRYNFGSD